MTHIDSGVFKQIFFRNGKKCFKVDYLLWCDVYVASYWKEHL